MNKSYTWVNNSFYIYSLLHILHNNKIRTIITLIFFYHRKRSWVPLFFTIIHINLNIRVSLKRHHTCILLISLYKFREFYSIGCWWKSISIYDTLCEKEMCYTNLKSKYIIKGHTLCSLQFCMTLEKNYLSNWIM